MGIALLTGPSSGIGRAAALALGRNGFHVVAAGRSPQRVAPVLAEIEQAGGSAEFLPLDLSSLDSLHHAAHTFLASGRTLEALVNNAGVGVARGMTVDGFEIHFGVNHLGHFALTRLLGPSLGPGARVVTLASAMHHRVAELDFDMLRQSTRSLFGLKEYSVSKLCNVLFTRELAARRPKWEAHAVHPGMVDTNIVPGYARPLLRLARRPRLTPEQGAATVVSAATTPGFGRTSGLYFANGVPTLPSPLGRNYELAAELWERSEQWCRANFPLP